MGCKALDLDNTEYCELMFFYEQLIPERKPASLSPEEKQAFLNKQQEKLASKGIMVV